MKNNLFGEIFAGMMLLLCFAAITGAQKPVVSTEDEITADVKSVTCKNGERLDAVRNLFKKMGAGDEEIKVEKIKDVENLVVVKKGKTDEKVVIGAHYDKTSDGCGVLDNWTGIVVMANIYRTMKAVDTQKTYVFVAFGKEELGLLGSNEMARAIPKEKRDEYCAMVNFDSFGHAYPQVMTNISDEKLTILAKETADEIKLPFAKARIEGASSDSESFRQQKIPGISIHGLNDKWQNYLHSSNDKIESVNMKAVYIAYRYGLNYLIKVDAKGCADFRK